MTKNKTKNPMKEVANILNDMQSIDVDVYTEESILTEEFIQKVESIDWKLWEILKLLQKFDEDEGKESDG